MSRRLLYRILWIFSLAAIGGMTYLFATQPAALPLPGPTVTYHTADGSIRIQHPQNWKVREAGAHAVLTELRIAPTRSVQMLIVEDLQGSLMADTMKSSDAQLGSLASMVPGGEAMLKGRKSPLERLHEMGAAARKKDKENYPGYTESDPTKTEVAGREALISDCGWSEQGIFSSRPMVGRRITMLSGDHHVTVSYGCLKEMKRLIMPMFESMVNSLEVDGQGGAK